MHKVRFPKFDANVIEGQVGGWLMEVGDRVEEDDSLVELITDKATFDLPAECVGTLRQIIAAEKSVVPVNYVIALVGEPDEELIDVSAENEEIVRKHREEAVALKAAQAATKASEAAPAVAKKKVRAKPAARRVAREAGIDLADVSPADGKIVTEADVCTYLEANAGSD